MRRVEVAATIAAELEPVLGPHMSKAAVDGHCSSLNLDGEHIEQPQIAELLRRIGLGLYLFVGRDKADNLVRGLYRRLTGEALQ